MKSRLKVVLDTNILISALIYHGRTRDFILTLLLKDVEFIISDYIIAEIENVLRQNKLKDKKILNTLLELITKDIQVVRVDSKVSKTPLRDPKDHPILTTAQKAKAQYIITGDKDLLSLRKWKTIMIVSMKEFKSILQEE